MTMAAKPDWTRCLNYGCGQVKVHWPATRCHRCGEEVQFYVPPTGLTPSQADMLVGFLENRARGAIRDEAGLAFSCLRMIGFMRRCPLTAESLDEWLAQQEGENAAR